MSTDAAPPTVHSTKLAPLTALLSVAVGCVVLTGWAFDIAVLKSISPDWVSMKANSAVCFILTGVALLLTARPAAVFNPRHAPYFLRLASFASLMVGLLSILTLCEYVFSWNPGIDQWLFVEPAATVGTSNPGRMAPETILCFILLAVALWLTSGARKTRLRILTSVSCSLLVVALALAAMQSYLTPELGPYGWFGLSIMAMHSAILFAILGTSVIAVSWRQDILPWSLSGRTSAAFACGMVLLVFVGLNSTRSEFMAKELNRQIVYSEELLRSIVEIQLELTEAEAHTRGYIITGDQGFLNAYLDDIADYNKRMDTFRRLIAGDPYQQQISRLETDIKSFQQWSQKFMDTLRTGMSSAARSKTQTNGDGLLDSIHGTFDQIENEYQQHINELRQESKSVARLSYTIIAVNCLGSLLIFLGVIFRLNFAVNERKRAEAEFQKSNKFLQTIVENVPGLVFWKDRDSRFLGCNTECAKDAGYLSPDELIGKTDFDLGWKDLAGMYRADDKEVMESGESKLSYEEQLPTADGKIFWVRTSKAPLRDENNQIVGIIGAAQNITEHKLAEDQLRESELRYRSLFENMLEGYAYCKMLFEHDTPLDFIYLNVNKSFEKITGLKNVTGKKVTEAIPGIRATNPELFEIYGRAALTGQPAKFETHVEALGIWFSIKVYSPQKGYFVAMFDDISERKQAEDALQQREAELRILVEHSPIAMIVDVGVDADEKILMMNQKFTKLFGYTMQDVPDVRHWWPLAYPDEKYREEVKAEWIANVSKAIQSHSDIEPMETKVNCKDGSIRYIRLSLSSIGNRNIVAFEDLTKRRLAESQLNQQLDELRRWQNATLGREARILELKHEVNGLLLKTGQPARYPSAEAGAQ
jgi:PAS domain S-box-containing protein